MPGDMGGVLQMVATKAENLLEKSELPKLADFYRALVDAYPGQRDNFSAVFGLPSSPLVDLLS